MMMITRKDKERGGEDMRGGESVSCYSLFHHQNPVLSSGSPATARRGRVFLQPSSEYSPSSSSFSNGFRWSEDGLPYAPIATSFEEARYQTLSSHYVGVGVGGGGFCLDSRSPHGFRNVSGDLLDEVDLSEAFHRMNVREDHNWGGGVNRMRGFEMDPHGLLLGVGSGDSSFGGSGGGGVGALNDHVPYLGFDNGVLDFEGFQPSAREEYGFQGGLQKGVCNSRSISGRFGMENEFLLQMERRKNQESRWTSGGSPLYRQYRTSHISDDAFLRSQDSKFDPFEDRGPISRFDSPHLAVPQFDDVGDPLYRTLMLGDRTTRITNNGFPKSLISVPGAEDIEDFSFEDGFALQGNGLNSVSRKQRDPFRGDKKNSLSEISVQKLPGKRTINQDSYVLDGGNCKGGRVVPSVSFLSEVEGSILSMAHDQNGCRFLQRIFEEGTTRDIDMVFNEIIDHVLELMLKPFGNYVIQKLLEVCSDEQRIQIVLMVTKEQGQLLAICLNTYGTRVVQKLIETLANRREIALVILALKPGFLDLVKDQNGNHVIQRCLQSLSYGDNKFIFDGAAKFCVDIATHRHGCCVMQRCIAYCEGKHREKLMHHVARNGLHLAQDPFGNYVVQYIIEQKIPSVMVTLLAQFKGSYVHLATQKFSSHVVEKCLKHVEESRGPIVRELLSAPRFEQLLQDPFANYVIQSALAVTKGSLHSLLVEAVRPHMVLRTSPYCKRIFTRNLLKK